MKPAIGCKILLLFGIPCVLQGQQGCSSWTEPSIAQAVMPR
jgi:hypothetical protein